MGLLKLLKTAHDWADRKLENVNTYFYARAEKEKEIRRTLELRKYSEDNLKYLLQPLTKEEQEQLTQAVLNSDRGSLNFENPKIDEFCALNQERITKLANAWNIENNSLKNTPYYIQTKKIIVVPQEKTDLVQIVQKEPAYTFLANPLKTVYGKAAAAFTMLAVGAGIFACLTYNSPASAAPVRNMPGITTINQQPALENPIETQNWAPKQYPRTGEQRQAIGVSEKASQQYVEEVGGDVNAQYPEAQQQPAAQQTIDSVVNTAGSGAETTADTIQKASDNAESYASCAGAAEEEITEEVLSSLELKVRTRGGHCTPGPSVLIGGPSADPFNSVNVLSHELKSDGTVVDTYGPFYKLKGGAQIYVRERFPDGNIHWFNQNVTDVSDAGNTKIKYSYASAKADGRVAMIVDAYKNSSMTVKQIKETFGLSKSSVYRLLKNEGESTRTAAAKRNALEQRIAA